MTNWLSGNGIDLLGRDGSASVWLPQHDGVSEGDESCINTHQPCRRITQENKLGQRFIGANDFLKSGIPASVLTAFVSLSSSAQCRKPVDDEKIICTVGYAIMRGLG